MKSNEDIVNALTEALERSNYSYRQDRRGNYLSTDFLKKTIDKIINEKVSSIHSNSVNMVENAQVYQKKVDDIIDKTGVKKITKATLKDYAKQQAKTYKDSFKQTYLKMGYDDKRAENEAKKKAKIMEKEFFKEAQESVNGLKNLDKNIKEVIDATNKTKEKEIEQAKLQNKIGVNAALTNGRSDQALRTFDKYHTITKALQTKFGENSIIGKIAGVWGKTVDTETSLGVNGAGAVGYAQMIIDAIMKGFEMASRFLQLAVQQNEAQFLYTSKELSLDSEMAMKELNNSIEIANKRAQAESSYRVNMAQAELSKYSGSLNAQILGFTDITGSVYKALDNALTYKYATQRAEIEKKYAIGDKSSVSILEKKLGVELKEKKSVTGAQKDLNKTQLERKENQIVYDQVGNVVSGVGMAAGAAVGAAAGGVGAGIGAAAGSQAGKIVDIFKAQSDYYYGLQEQGDNLKIQSRQIHESFTNATQSALSSMEQIALDAQKQIELSASKTQEEIEKAFANFTQDIDKKFEVAENFANEMGKSLGYFGNQLDKFEDSMFHTQVAVSAFGKKMEDMAKLQNEYSEATGRNAQFTTDDYMKSFAMGTFWGDDTIGQLNSGMEIFNHSVADSNEMFYEMQKSLIKMGLNGKKYGKDLVNNLKLAEKYNFKGGVKGLMEMSKWAQNVRFNTSSLDGMLDKVNEGGLEGLIKQSAELQVLGGNFAMGSDPLAMGWEALNDAGAYAKRINGMLSSLGVFNSSTGEVDVLGPNRIIAGQAAKSLGMSVEEVIKQIKQEGKISKIRSEIGGRFDEDQLSMITNKAKYIDGQWKVNLGKKDINGNDIMTNISDISSDDLKALVDDTGKSLEQLAIDNLSVQRQQEAAQSRMQAELENNFGDFKEQHITRIQNMLNNFWYNQENWKREITKYMTAATEEASLLNSFFGKDNANELGNKLMAQTNLALSDIYGQVQSIAKKIGAEYGITGQKLESVGGDRNLLKILNHMESYTGDTRFAKYKNALADLDVGGSKWYTDPELTSAMNTLRANPLSLLNVTKNDPSLRNYLFRLIYYWDDEGSTTDFNFRGNKELLKLAKERGIDIDPNTNPHGMRGGHTGLDTIEEKPLDQKIMENGYKGIQDSKDGIVAQNGSLTRIDSSDQVLAAKKDGPIDRMLDMVQPRPMQYNSYVRNNNVTNSDQVLAAKKDGPIEIKPLSVNINGNIQLNGTNVDFTSQMQNDPNFKEALWKLISIEVSKRADNSGRTYDPLYNRIQTLS